MENVYSHNLWRSEVYFSPYSRLDYPIYRGTASYSSLVLRYLTWSRPLGARGQLPELLFWVETSVVDSESSVRPRPV